MALSCPTCKRKNESAISVCPRCGTELEVLFQIQTQAENACHSGCLLLQRGDVAGAGRAFLRSWQLKHSNEAEQGLALTTMAQRHYGTAIKWYADYLKRNEMIDYGKKDNN